MSFQRIAKFIVSMFFRVFYRVKVHGKEHWPPSGTGYVLCSNHANWIDPLLIGTANPGLVRYMAKKELFDTPVLNLLVKGLGAFPVDRQGSDLKAIKTAVSLLKSGGILGIFPEGTRTLEEDVSRAKPGIAMIAVKASVTVVPVAIAAEKAYRPFSRIHIVIGAPMRLSRPASRGRGAKSEYQAMSESIMQTIYDLKKQVPFGKSL